MLYFGGGTAVVLSLDEYRESVGVDFLCASADGFRLLRNTVSDSSVGPLLRVGFPLAREVRSDRYGIRTVVQVDGTPIRIEWVREDRIEISGIQDARFRVPTLSREDMFAEKLLANADRGSDRSTASRDIIDLAMMMDRWGPIPESAWDKVRAAYGAHVDKAFRVASDMVCDRNHLQSCLAKMHMDAALLDRIPQVLGCRSRPVAAPEDSHPSLSPP